MAPAVPTFPLASELLEAVLLTQLDAPSLWLSPTSTSTAQDDALVVPQLVRTPGGRAVAGLLGVHDTFSRLDASDTSDGVENHPVVVAALKLLVATDPNPAAGAAGFASEATARSLRLGRLVATVAAQGLPVSPDAVAAALVADSAAAGHPLASVEALEKRLGPEATALVHDVASVRRLPARSDLLSDSAATALRGLCLSMYAPQAVLVEFLARLDALREADAAREAAAAGGLPLGRSVSMDDGGAAAGGVAAALEGLRVFSGLGHSLGLAELALEMEELCLRALFPEALGQTHEVLRRDGVLLRAALGRAEDAVRRAASQREGVAERCAGLEVHGRAKSLISVMKRVLGLGRSSTAAGRQGPDLPTRLAPDDLHDVLGLRIVVHPLPPGPGLSAPRADEMAVEACYLVMSAVRETLREVPGRAKDYIERPKPNGYASLHATFMVDAGIEEHGWGGGRRGWRPGDGDRDVAVEVQVRTSAMHAEAERGEAAHGAYKGGGVRGGAELWALAVERSEQLDRAPRTLPPGSPSCELTTAALPSPGGGGAWDASADGVFESLDLDGNGGVDRAELAVFLKDLLGDRGETNLLSQSSIEAAVDEIFALCDTDCDGVLSRAEFRALRRRLIAGGSVGGEVGGAPGPRPTRGPATPGALHGAGCRQIRRRRGPAPPRAHASRAAAAEVAGLAAAAPVGDDGEAVETAASDEEAAASVPPGPSPLLTWDEDGESTPVRVMPAGKSGTAKNVTPVVQPVSPQSSDGRSVVGSTPWALPPSHAWVLAPLDPRDPSLPTVFVAPLGPTVVGATHERGSDFIVDLPWVSGSHLRLEILRRGGRGRRRRLLHVTDLGSLNGTWLNGEALLPHRDVPVRPGDVLSMGDPAGGGAAWVVRTERGGAPGADDGGAAAARALELAGASGLGSLEANDTDGRDDDDAACDEDPTVAARALALAGDCEAAAVLLTRALVREPRDARALAALGSLHAVREGGIGAAPARLLYRAAAAELVREGHARRSAADADVSGDVPGFLLTPSPRAPALDDADPDRLCRLLREWARSEARCRHDTAARRLFRYAAEAGRRCPRGGTADRADPVVVTLHQWAHWEWRALHCSRVALPLLDEALERQSGSWHAWQLRGHILAETGRVNEARASLAASVAAANAAETVGSGSGSVAAAEAARAAYAAGSLQDLDPGPAGGFGGPGRPDAAQAAPALQAWARVEARHGQLRVARLLFGRAAAARPSDAVVLQSWAVAEGAAGELGVARSLFRRALRAVGARDDDDDGDAAARDPLAAAPILQAWSRLEAAETLGDSVAAVKLQQRAALADPSARHRQRPAGGDFASPTPPVRPGPSPSPEPTLN